MSILSRLAPYLAGTVAGLLVLAALKRQAARRKLPRPPGPKPLPLVGNLFDFPKEKAWLTYRALNERYGDVIYLEALGTKLLILGTSTAVNDLMDRRSAVYSSRSSPVMKNDLSGFVWLLSNLPYGDVWRRGRKLLHAHVNLGVAPKYYPIQLNAAHRFVRDVLSAKQDKEVLPALVRANFGYTIIKIVYGINARGKDDEYLSLPEKVLQTINAVAQPGRFLVDLLPILKYVPEWFPGADFQRIAREARTNHRRMRDKPIAVVKAGMADGTAPPSVVQAMLEEDAALPSEQSELDLIKDLAGVAYLGGSDTTVAAVVSFFLAMLVYPDVQAKAQAEIDRVIGTDRLPEMSDEPNLPYVQAVVNECYRWLPVLPMGVPHMTTRDDEYNGYLVPKGTLVFGSVWAILHNPEDYPDPEVFKPERYLTPAGDIDTSVRDPRTACFGFGRRICPGRHLADASLFTMVSTLLATVDIVRAKDAQGKEIIPEVDVGSGALSHPKPFSWSVRPRSTHAEEMLKAALAAQ